MKFHVTLSFFGTKPDFFFMFVIKDFSTFLALFVIESVFYDLKMSINIMYDTIETVFTTFETFYISKSH